MKMKKRDEREFDDDVNQNEAPARIGVDGARDDLRHGEVQGVGRDSKHDQKDNEPRVRTKKAVQAWRVCAGLCSVLSFLGHEVGISFYSPGRK